MNVKKTKEASKLVIALEGKFDAISAPQFEEEISNDLNSITELYIDMQAVEYISSAGLRTLLYLQQTMQEKGRMVIRNVPEIVSSVFEVTGFDEIITIE